MCKYNYAGNVDIWLWSMDIDAVIYALMERVWVPCSI